MANCRYCGKEITWMADGRKKIPVEGDGNIHECDEYKNSRNSIRKVEKGSLSADEIKKYEEAINQGKKK